MATLDELFEKFGSAVADENGYETGTPRFEENLASDSAGATKLASGGDAMNSLQDIYLTLEQSDLNKEAAQAAYIPQEEDVDFAKMAAQLADAEADDIVQYEEQEEYASGDIIKIASEYDAAGRIMARGFYDEFNKLAGNMDTDVSPNQNTESVSAASTPALGDRGLPTVETNYAGSPNNDQSMETAGQGPKQVYMNVLKPAKTISAGQGTGDDPEAAAISLGGGSPSGFATVRDLAGGKPA